MSRQSDLDNHANQLNPNNDEYWNCRGEDNPEDYDQKPETIRNPSFWRRLNSY